MQEGDTQATAPPTGRATAQAREAEVDVVWFHAAVERHRSTVFRVAYSYLRSPADADDVCQDTFVALWRCSREFASDEHLRAWLIRVAINRCKNELRRPWRRVADIDDYADALAMPERDRELLQAVMALPERHRVPLHLYYYEGYQAREIAQMLGIKESTAQSRLDRARKRLRRALEEDGSND